MDIRTRQNNRFKGNLGEDLEFEFLKKKSYEILERNWHYSKFAEVDIVAKKGDKVIFFEVKTRSSTNFGHPLEAISFKKLERIYKAALNYIEVNDLRDFQIQIDAISIVGLKFPKIEHIENITF